MAIKGKNKSKRTRRKAAAPKAAPVERKPPFLARTWVQITAVALLICVLTIGFTYAYVRQTDREKETKQQAIEAKITASVKKTIADTTAPLGSETSTGFTALPELGPAIDGLRSGDTKAPDAAKTASDTEKKAQDAQAKLGKLDLNKVAEGKGASDIFVQDLLDAQTRMSEALSLFQQATMELTRATKATGADQKQLLSAASQDNILAGVIFDDGFAKWIRAQSLAGTYVPVQSSQAQMQQQLQKQLGGQSGPPLVPPSP